MSPAMVVHLPAHDIVGFIYEDKDPAKRPLYSDPCTDEASSSHRFTSHQPCQAAEMDRRDYTSLTPSIGQTSPPTISHSIDFTSPPATSAPPGNGYHLRASTPQSTNTDPEYSYREEGPDAMTLRQSASDPMLSGVNFKWSNPKSQRYGIFAACGVAVLLFFTLSSHAPMNTWGAEKNALSGNIPAAEIKISKEQEQLIKTYINHIVRPMPQDFQVNTSHWSQNGWVAWDLPENEIRHWTEPMGKDLCIFDFDNREFNQSGELWADEPMSWSTPGKVHGLSLGVLNHWLYAKIHGYKYYYIDIEHFPDGRRASWKKPVLIPALLQHHSTCVFMDSDAIFPHLSLPFEWIMNHFALDPELDVLAMAVDPDKPYNKDRRGKLYLNTGFIVAQSHPKTDEIMEAWRTCPDEGSKYPDCEAFKSQTFNVTDQGGFGTFIRYDFEENVKHLPCKEANGFPESETECMGELISHLWTGKDSWLKQRMGEQTPGDLLEALHLMFRREAETFRLHESVVLEERREGKRQRRWWEE